MTTRQAGFTLIEVMIAITIMAVLSVICWRALDSVTRTEERLRANDAVLTADLRVLQQLQRDIDMRVVAESFNGPPRRADEPQRLLPPALLTTRESGGRLAIEITRRVGGSSTAWQRVRWYQQGGTVRRSAGTPAMQPPLPAPDTARAIIVAQDVQRMGLRAWQPRRGWTALPSDADALPAQGLELTMQLRDARGPRTYRRVLPL